MVLKDISAGIFKLKINVGEHFNEKNEDLYIELREPTTEEALSLSATDDSDKQDKAAIFKMMPSLITDHNFEDENSKRFSSDDVWKFIMQRAQCATQIVTEWSNNIPLAKGKLEK